MRKDLLTRRTLLASGVTLLSAQGVASLALSRSEYLPSPPPLSELPSQVGNWTRTADVEVDPAALEMLAPDDVLHRDYIDQDRTPLNLFIGYYKTQHRARNAHDPKVCLPGSGWNPLESKVIQVPVPDTEPIPVNYYVVQKQDQQNVVLYWYQNHNRAVAQEQLLRFDRLLSTLRENRTDMAFVRVIVPATNLRTAAQKAMEFIAAFHPGLMRQFPLPHV
jgi:EpsI family protein